MHMCCALYVLRRQCYTGRRTRDGAKPKSKASVASRMDGWNGRSEAVCSVRNAQWRRETAQRESNNARTRTRTRTWFHGHSRLPPPPQPPVARCGCVASPVPTVNMEGGGASDGAARASAGKACWGPGKGASTGRQVGTARCSRSYREMMLLVSNDLTCRGRTGRCGVAGVVPVANGHVRTAERVVCVADAASGRGQNGGYHEARA